MSTLDERIAAIRSFNRFYTRVIGVLQDAYLGERFTLAEARVIYELATEGGQTATALRGTLGLDGGYLSRILGRFEAEGLIARTFDGEDRRQAAIALTPRGRTSFRTIERRASAELAGLIGHLPDEAQDELVQAMQRIRTRLDDPGTGEVRLRDLVPGDMGWVLARHAGLYAEEYGFDARFEGLVAKVCASFLLGHDAASERGWIAERDGVRLGSVFLMRESDTDARLRLLLVEPAARGIGLGRRLTETCVAFAREAGYGRVVLWTNDILAAARGIYAQAGFRLERSAPHEMFGPRIVGEDWVLDVR
jgi:DNA-binding MarR family transcriptional regulator/predicted GNAT family acetyltransferase